MEKVPYLLDIYEVVTQIILPIIFNIITNRWKKLVNKSIFIKSINTYEVSKDNKMEEIIAIISEYL
ncbi:MAG: hypothetical protein QW108_04310 [Saccharolobus sp.]